ncbi:MAG: cation transporter [Defluviitaleaceae bacterium]|nr:cation transporter [Defluviitaleaceae bacterium]
MKKEVLNVSGMSCGHCEKAVIMALEDIGVAEVIASSTEQKVEITFDPAKLTLETIEKEIAEAGYIVIK